MCFSFCFLQNGSNEQLTKVFIVKKVYIYIHIYVYVYVYIQCIIIIIYYFYCNCRICHASPSFLLCIVLCALKN